MKNRSTPGTSDGCLWGLARGVGWVLGEILVSAIVELPFAILTSLI